MGKKVSFENSRKTVETIFDLIYWFGIISLGLAILLEILHKTGTPNIYTVSTKSVIVTAISTAIMYYSARLAHKGKLAAGIIGIIVSVLYIISNNLLNLILGIILLVDSILYIVNFKR